MATTSEKKVVGKSIGEWKDSGTIVKFLTTIGIRQRERVKEKEVEWTKRYDQEDKNLLG